MRLIVTYFSGLLPDYESRSFMFLVYVCMYCEIYITKMFYFKDERIS